MISDRLKISVDCNETIQLLTPIWRSFGYDEINWTYTPRGKRIFAEIAQISEAPYYIRCHNTFTSGNGLSIPTKGSTNLCSLDANGEMQLDFRILDQVIATFLQNGCRPIIELGFMPDALSSGPKPKPAHALIWIWSSKEMLLPWPAACVSGMGDGYTVTAVLEQRNGF